MDKVEELVLESERPILAHSRSLTSSLRALDRISGQHSDLHKAFARLSNFFQHVIDDHLKPGQPEDHSDIISVMLNMINKQSKDVSLAGVNAGAITMIWAMIELTIHPKVLKEIQQEIRFIPERFIVNPIGYKGQHFEFLSFAGGCRICPGMATEMTIMEAHLTLCEVLSIGIVHRLEQLGQVTRGQSMSLIEEVH
ncbi:hypothetical protein YC2023_019535 [Brassica napus]